MVFIYYWILSFCYDLPDYISRFVSQADVPVVFLFFPTPIALLYAL